MRARRRASVFYTIAIAAILFVCTALPAAAHSRRTASGPATGIAISNLTHGQMAVIAGYRAAILRLAAAQETARDQSFRRVLNYARIQFSYCMWGLAPGGVADEESPFNECSHAYLAAARDLLLRMNAAPAPEPRVAALMADIDMEMVRNKTSLVLCRYSDESFNTADIIRPEWNRVPFHLPSLAAFAGLSLIVGGGLYVGSRKGRTG